MPGLAPLPTAAIADACVRLQVPERAVALRPILPTTRVGRALTARHAGSVDVFLEAFQQAKPGDVLVIDNEGRMDEGCIGDLTALEAQHHGVSAIVVDGCHRDSSTLLEMGFPVWSRGAFPFGPRTARPRAADALERARVAGSVVERGDVVAMDADGVVFVPAADAPRVWELASRIQKTEAGQAEAARRGQPLCEQFQVREFLRAQAKDPSLTFRAHLRRLGRSIEE